MSSFFDSAYQVAFIVPMTSRNNKRIRAPPPPSPRIEEVVDDGEGVENSSTPPSHSSRLDAARKKVRTLKAELVAAEREVRQLEREEEPEEQLQRAIFLPITRQMRGFGNLPSSF